MWLTFSVNMAARRPLLRFTQFYSYTSQFHSPRPRQYSKTSKVMTASTSAALYVASVSALTATSAVPEDVGDKRHHLESGKGFDNPWPSWKLWTSSDMMRMMFRRRFLGEGKTPDTTPPTVNVRTPEFLTGRSTDSPLRATWLGHACYYVEFPSGLRVLFDPVFSDCCGPYGRLGPKRYTPQPCKISDIPAIDVVCISHSHYDHLDHPTIMQILHSNPNCHFFAPLGNKKWFIESKVPASQVTELDWWEERGVELTATKTGASSSGDGIASIKATVSALPCQHSSGRTPFDRAQTLWSSWSVKSGNSSVYFAGDTGYRTVPQSLDPAEDHKPETQGLHPSCPAFAQVGQLRGPFDLALIPIGAYEPRWIMSPMHADPFDAVEIARDIRARRALGMHWGTWVLTEEDVLEPPKLLREALRRRNMPETGVFDVCEIGESRLFESPGEGDKTVDWEAKANAKL